MSDNNGLWDGLVGGLLGPSEKQLAELRRKYGIPDAEAPCAMVSMGRGAMDLWEPAKQMYLDRVDPVRAAAYRKQRDEEERLYQRGLLAGNPLPPDAPKWAQADLSRQFGQAATAALLLLPGLMALPATAPEAAMSVMLTGGVYDALNTLRQRFGLFD